MVSGLSDRVTGDRSWSVGHGFVLYGVDPPVCSVGVVRRLVCVSVILKKHIWRNRCDIILGGELPLGDSPGDGEVGHKAAGRGGFPPSVWGCLLRALVCWGGGFRFFTGWSPGCCSLILCSLVVELVGVLLGFDL